MRPRSSAVGVWSPKMPDCAHIAIPDSLPSGDGPVALLVGGCGLGNQRIGREQLQGLGQVAGEDDRHFAWGSPWGAVDPFLKRGALRPDDVHRADVAYVDGR